MGVVTGESAPPANTSVWPARIGAFGDRWLAWLDMLGDQLVFYARALAWTPRALRRYPREIARLLAEVSFGGGALALIGGTVGVMIALTLFTGTVVGLQGYAALNQIGAAAFTGSGSMFAEAIHSTADCGNQILLLFGLKQARRPASPLHPLGAGRAIYFYSLIVALLLFFVNLVLTAIYLQIVPPKGT